MKIEEVVKIVTDFVGTVYAIQDGTFEGMRSVNFKSIGWLAFHPTEGFRALNTVDIYSIENLRDLNMTKDPAFLFPPYWERLLPSIRQQNHLLDLLRQHYRSPEINNKESV